MNEPQEVTTTTDLARIDLDTVLSTLDGWGLRRTLLATRDAHGLYERVGFEVMDDPARWMRRWRPGSQRLY